jgi:hypothetical protein
VATLRLSRRTALTLGAAIVGVCLLGGQQVARAQTPAPAQVPRPPSGTMSPGSTIPAGGSSMQAGSVLGTWLWQRTEMSDGTVITAADPTQYVLGFGAASVIGPGWSVSCAPETV